MTATDELRALLDERGVEYEGGERSVRWRDRNGVMMQAFPLADGELGMEVWSCTPEQAIAATLGRGECHVDGGECDQCGAWVRKDAVTYWIPTGRGMQTEETHALRFCPNCGRKVVDA